MPGTAGRQRAATTVRADDGVPLHVEFDGDPDAPLTVLLTHGFTASAEEWDSQVPALRGRARVVLWDHRGHGRSGWNGAGDATIERTARDLEAVLYAVVPAGPVVLGGHSMGGMTIMALARRRPELFGPRVAGVFLLATSSGGLLRTGPLGRGAGVLRRAGLLALSLRQAQRLAPVLERRRRRGSEAGRRFTRRYLFGREDADPAHVRQVQDLIERTPYPVSMAFWGTFAEHDESAALPVLGRVPVTVVAAGDDRLTPASHGRRIARLVPGAELVVVPGAGHAVNLTRPEVVDRALLGLLDRVQEGPWPPRS